MNSTRVKVKEGGMPGGGSVSAQAVSLVMPRKAILDLSATIRDGLTDGTERTDLVCAQAHANARPSMAYLLASRLCSRIRHGFERA
jgi:hypothetical protein